MQAILDQYNEAVRALPTRSDRCKAADDLDEGFEAMEASVTHIRAAADAIIAANTAVLALFNDDDDSTGRLDSAQ